MYDPYKETTPYQVLGLSPDATAVQIRDCYNALQRELQEQGMSVSDRSKRKQELDAAYNQLRVAAERVKVDFRILDPLIGKRQCETIAATFATPDTTVEGLIKPKSIRVTHATMLAEPPRFTAEPERVGGLHPRAIPDAERSEIPELLAIHFDC
jgi:hypothetical protein